MSAPSPSPSSQEIVRAAGKWLAPIVILYAAYLAAAGVDGVGGGFAAGAVFALGCVLHALVFGIEAARNTFPARLAIPALALGVLFFVALGALSLLRGHAFLDYEALLPNGGLRAQRMGVTLSELAVAIATAGGFVASFHALAGRAGDMKDSEW